VVNVIKNVQVHLKNSRQIEWVPRYQSDMEHLDIFYKYF